jgi:hypothetical protein
MVRKAALFVPVLLLVAALFPAAVFAQTATPVPSATPFASAEIEVEGLVESLQNNLLVIGGQTIDVSGAVIESGVQVGRFAEAYVTPRAGSTWAARLVELHHDDDSNKVEIKGIATEVGSNFVVIGGRRFDTTNAFLGANVAAGAFVELDLRFNNAGQWVSVELRLDDIDDRNDDRDDDDRDDDLNDDRGGDRDDDDDDDNSGPGSGRDDNQGMGNSGRGGDDDDDHSGSDDRGGDDDDHGDDHGGDRGDDDSDDD